MSSTDTGKAREWQTEEIQKEIHNTDYHKLYNTGSNNRIQTKIIRGCPQGMPLLQ